MRVADALVNAVFCVGWAILLCAGMVWYVLVGWRDCRRLVQDG